jgi:hypothetical protein
VVYKLISKVFVNRLKGVLSFIISSTQSAFFPVQLIMDNILVAYEMLHTMHTRMLSKFGYMGIKLDMSKVYDRMEWAFLEAVMKKMEFSDRWIRLIMECSYAILINSQPVGNILPPRGL